MPMISQPTGRHYGLAGVLVLLVAACGADEPNADRPSRTDEAVMEARERALEKKDLGRAPGPEPAVVGEVPEPVMGEVRAHLARRTGAQPDTFEVLRAESRVWPDGSMGCPQPDVVYTQAEMPGYWIVLAHAGREYDYRVSESGWFVLCEGTLLENPPVD